VPGTAFFASGRTSAYVRASFSVLGDEETDEAVRRLGVVIREARGKNVDRPT
jgi:tryptophan aminotransferase